MDHRIEGSFRINSSGIENGMSQMMTSVSSILLKARQLYPLSTAEIFRLLTIEDPQEEERLFQAAQEVKEMVFGKRILLFAPLYLSNQCRNDCLYCGFRKSNKTLQRFSLLIEEVEKEAEYLQEEGHRRILLVTSESSQQEMVSFLERVIARIKRKTAIRSVQINPPPLSIGGCARLFLAGYGTYQVFQETYHEKTYSRMHPIGPKRLYRWRLEAVQRGIRAGWNSFGMGILLGLFDWRFEIPALLSHVRYLEKRFGIGPRTISLPRLRPSAGAPLQQAPYSVDDRTFLKLLAVIRLAVPYAETVLSTREPASLRDQALKAGVSQMSAGSRTSPGGYLHPEREQQSGQFYLSDHRSLKEIVEKLTLEGYIPSFSIIEDQFCDLRREDFLTLARKGRIKELVTANARRSLERYDG